MKIALTVFVAMFLFVIAVSGQEVENWTRYTSNTGAYSVLLPNEPKLKEQDMAAPGGTKVKQYLATSSVAGQIFMVGYFDVTSGMTYSLDKGRDGMVKAIDGTVVSEELISLGGKPGRRMRVLAKLNDRNVTDLVRMYEINGRVYVLQSMFLETTEEAPYVARANKFFDSFAVKDR